MDGLLAALGKTHRIFAPKRPKTGSGPVRYGEIGSLSEFALEQQSDFSPKEVFHPIMQTMLRFQGSACTQSELDPRGLVVFARPCDINALRRLDTIFLHNAARPAVTNAESGDYYYARMREKVKVFMIECSQGWDNCFCVSLGTNKSGDYAGAFRFGADGVLVDLKNENLAPFFQGLAPSDFTPAFVEENLKKVPVPQIGEKDLAQVRALGMWKDYDEKCVSCGSCTAVCPSCSCFDTTDVIYNETSRSGERRRIWASCMQAEFSAMAGGHTMRPMPGERLRFRVLHKIYDYKARFGVEHMCVGCGRCDSRCPADISYTDALGRLSAEMAEIEKTGGAR
jgi:anaerobic sulfite reductase subunit A